MGRGRKKERQKNKKRKTKGQWESIPPLTPASLNFGVAVVTVSKGQGRGDRMEGTGWGRARGPA